MSPMHPRASSAPLTLLRLMRDYDVGLVSKIYGYAGDLKTMFDVWAAFAGAGIRSYPKTLRYLADCYALYELPGCETLHDHVAADDVDALRRDLMPSALDNPNVRNKQGLTLLQWAVMSRAERCVDFLLQHPKVVVGSLCSYRGEDKCHLLYLAFVVGEAADEDEREVA